MIKKSRPTYTADAQKVKRDICRSALYYLFLSREGLTRHYNTHFCLRKVSLDTDHIAVYRLPAVLDLDFDLGMTLARLLGKGIGVLFTGILSKIDADD